MSSASKIEVKAESPPLHPDSDGTIRIGATRITLDTIVAAFEEGLSPEEILAEYDVLNRLEVYSAITFYLGHKTEVVAYLEERVREAERLEQALRVEGKIASDEQKAAIKARWKLRQPTSIGSSSASTEAR